MSAVIAHLVDRINAEHTASQTAAESAVEHARRCGELLAEAKGKVKHGDWQDWLTGNCPNIADRTARAYMRLHREMRKLEPEKRQRVADLSIRDAMRAVAASTGALRQVPVDRLPAVETRWNDKGGSIYGVARGEAENARAAAFRAPLPAHAQPTDRSREPTTAPPEAETPEAETPEFYTRTGCIPHGYGYTSWSAKKKEARGLPQFKDARKELQAAKKRVEEIRQQMYAAEEEVCRIERELDKASHAICVQRHFSAAA